MPGTPAADRQGLHLASGRDSLQSCLQWHTRAAQSAARNTAQQQQLQHQGAHLQGAVKAGAVDDHVGAVRRQQLDQLLRNARRAQRGRRLQARADAQLLGNRKRVAPAAVQLVRSAHCTGPWLQQRSTCMHAAAASKRPGRQPDISDGDPGGSKGARSGCSVQPHRPRPQNGDLLARPHLHVLAAVAGMTSLPRQARSPHQVPHWLTGTASTMCQKVLWPTWPRLQAWMPLEKGSTMAPIS